MPLLSAQRCLSAFGVSDPATTLKLIDAKAIRVTVYSESLNGLREGGGRFKFSDI